MGAFWHICAFILNTDGASVNELLKKIQELLSKSTSHISELNQLLVFKHQNIILLIVDFKELSWVSFT